MRKGETEIKLKNDQLNLESIRTETIQAAKELSSKYEEKAAVEADIDKAREQLAEETRAIEAKRKDLIDEQKRTSQLIEIVENRIRTAEEEIGEVHRKKDELMKELKRLNQWIMTAEEAKAELTKTIEALQIECNKKSALIIDIEILKNELHDLEDQRNRSKSLSEMTISNARAELLEIQKQRMIEEQKRDKAIRETEEEGYKLHRLRDDKARIKEDLLVVVGRVEALYQKAFPGLRTNIIDLEKI